MRPFSALAVLFAISLSTTAETPAGVVDRVVVLKHDHKLILLSHGKELRSYRIALGGDPVGPKTRQGDHKTPEGIYLLDSRNPQSQFYKSLHVSYPNSKDIANARKLGVNPGGDIMVHGLPKKYAWVGKSHAMHDWTEGCIAVTDEEMDEIWKLVRIGTTIEIKP